MRKAIFPGSFNPYTIGHDDILRRGLEMFDAVVICIGVNPGKPDDHASALERARHIAGIYAGEPRVQVVVWDGLTADCARAHGARWLLRGVRSVKDFEYERDLADANHAVGGVETVMLAARPELAWISSSLVRELKKHGREVRDLLPPPALYQ